MTRDKRNLVTIELIAIGLSSLIVPIFGAALLSKTILFIKCFFAYLDSQYYFLSSDLHLYIFFSFFRLAYQMILPSLSFYLSKLNHWSETPSKLRAFPFLTFLIASLIYWLEISILGNTISSLPIFVLLH
jgi:apolipoprotein N-acyltransferase